MLFRGYYFLDKDISVLPFWRHRYSTTISASIVLVPGLYGKVIFGAITFSTRHFGVQFIIVLCYVEEVIQMANRVPLQSDVSSHFAQS